ncbi:MAG: zinc ribbon domain-containing protein [Thermoanaerobaculales bacterium]|nr:zinc ribbon domain-containing protein [Thermoanaerobaculales bacterium]
MPIYEYRCNLCAHMFSRLQRISATTDDIRCPKCESGEVERLVSSFASAGTSGVESGSGPSAPSCSGFT